VNTMRHHRAPAPALLTLLFIFFINFKIDFTKFIKSLFFNIPF
jgi:hypothetical protein